MARTHRFSFAGPLCALATVLVVTFAAPAPAGARTATAERRQRDQARAKQAELARKIDALKASDDDLERAVQALESQVQAQQARVASARQAVAAAESQRQVAEQRLQQTQADMAATRSSLVARAIEAYVQPQQSATSEQLVVSGDVDLGEMSRRAALLNELAGRDQEALDHFHGLQVDLGHDQDIARQAKALADHRRQLEDQSLTQLRQAASAKQSVQDAIEARIKDYQDEADAVAKQESSLSSLIRSKETVTVAPSSGDQGGSGGGGVVSGQVSASGLMWPVSGPLTSGFGYRWGRLHAGIDIAVGIGTPIHAARSGVVIFSGVMSGYGNVVVIDHGGGLSTLYAHQSRTAASEGESVSQGQVIGYSGNTGHSTGPHVHFETRIGGNPQNPRPYLP
jgi:murein DD-endopeptidase MepM/ murein hydrolase activator NlpD